MQALTQVLKTGLKEKCSLHYFLQWKSPAGLLDWYAGNRQWGKVMTWIIKEILEGDLGWSKIGSWGWIKERFYCCGFPGEISICYLAAGWIGQMLDMLFIKTFLRPWEFIRYSVLMVAQRVQKIFPSDKHGWQGQMEAGWFGEIQTDFWMLLDQCLRGEVDYLGHWQTTPAPIINGCCTTASVLS